MLRPTCFLLMPLAAGFLLAASSNAQQAAPSAQSQPPAAQKQNTPAPAPSAADKKFPTLKEKSSYAIGLNIGRSMHTDSLDVDPDLLLRGLKDGLSGGNADLTDEEVKETLDALRKELVAQHDAKLKAEGEANQKVGDAFLTENKTKPGVVALPSGLQYKILVAGTGPKPTAADTVVCNYKGTLLDNTEFDSSYKRGEPATFPVSGIIKGWTEALQLMPVGSKWQLFIPPDLAYGERGAARGGIGPNSTLVFEVELLSIKPKTEPPQTPAPNPQPNPGL
ncbi:MAG TPA: FKBP-type peptidyl-prolyl cis-trans isomerase [Candidatus Acidoferrum sp.]|nr:FKBP-type peptidyl-prolyl cis-trans isomerase [Candidatus Acidoferrum sp.]